jgi:hypothetical protein
MFDDFDVVVLEREENGGTLESKQRNGELKRKARLGH